MVATANLDSIRPISSLKAALIYGISALGKVPRRQWNLPPILSFRRHESSNTREDKLIQANNGTAPRAFLLSTFSQLDEPDSSHIAGHAAQQGTRIAHGDQGQRHTLRQVEVALTLSSTLYTTDLDDQLDYAAMLLEIRKGRGIVGKIGLDALSLPVTVAINKGFSMVDPTAPIEGATFLDRYHQLMFSATIRTRAATIERSPILREISFTSSLADGGQVTEDVEYVNPDDWGL